MSLLILEAGPLATVQDAGRLDQGRFGVPTSGPMDWFAFRAANGLVENPLNAAVIESGPGELVLKALDETVVAVAGAGGEIWVQERTRPLWMALRLRRGWVLKVDGAGCWTYVAVAGGIAVPPVLGARATYVRGRLGGLAGRPLQSGDKLPIGPTHVLPERMTVREVNPETRPAYSPAPTLDVILGPQAERFTEAALSTFSTNAYQVSALSDRMGYRLEGAALEHLGGADIVSDGMVMGSMQVPAIGQPIVMLADGPTTGGYPKIATVATADLPLLAQCKPGEGVVRFRPATVVAAQLKYRTLSERLEASLRASAEPAITGW